MVDSMLKVDKINVYYGNIHAVKDISFEVNEGEIVTLIGANGAGKSTTLNAIAGVFLVDKGKITIDGEEYMLREGESIVMPAQHPHAVYGEEQFKMMLVVIF